MGRTLCKLAKNSRSESLSLPLVAGEFVFYTEFTVKKEEGVFSMADKIMEQALEILRHQRYYDSIQGLMGWDLWEGLSKKGQPYRGEVSGYFTRQALAELKSPETRKVVDALKERKPEDFEDIYLKGAAHELCQRYDRAVQVPEDLQVEVRNYTGQAQMVWRDALDKNSFEFYKPTIKGLFELKKRVAEAIDPNRPAFDVLCGTVDKGIDTQRVQQLFAGLKKGIVEIMEQIAPQHEKIDTSVLETPYTHQQRRDAAFEINLLTGFDPDCAHDSQVLHGMCTGVGPRDSRIAISYKGVWGGIFTMLHEGGHARYGYSSNDRAVECSLWGGLSGAMHEGQARFYENIIGKSPEFWRLAYPVAVKHFPYLKDVPMEKFYMAQMKVQPSLHRITADELTYSLHPIIRFEMEKDYFDGKTNTDDFEEIWREKYKETFGLVLKDAREGVLQDIHWASGHIGYFQSYTLGNLYGGQMLHAMKKVLPNFDELVEKGEFAPINQWLYDNVHQFGRAMTPTEVLLHATGEELTETYFLDYLRDKYLNKLRNI